jgi:death-on-curing family protein
LSGWKTLTYRSSHRSLFRRDNHYYFPHQRSPVSQPSRITARPLAYEEAVRIVGRLRKQFGASRLFGKERDDSLHSSLNAVMQTFGGRDLYPGLEEKAANLLYFLVKNHSFVDGNKRIAATLFLWFLEKNDFLYRSSGEPRLSDVALVALTLMIANSHPTEKKPIVRMVTQLLCERPMDST